MAPTIATVPTPPTAWQASLLDAAVPRFDDAYTHADRRTLADDAWVEHVPGWLDGSDRLFEEVLALAPWGQPVVTMYEDRVLTPRLTAHWDLAEVPPALDAIRAVGASLSARYRVAFTRVGCNLYRDGRDSVAWHGDRIARDLPDATIAIVSLGHARPFRLRPRGGGPSFGFALGRGDLLVMGGSCQRTWQHAVPKVADAGPRISVTFRHAYPEVSR